MSSVPMPRVILVSENDEVMGHEEKMRAHELGLCHRAFSIFIFRNNQGLEILLQKRAQDKYHCPGLWTNACCSHPAPDEDTQQAAENRLALEMGINTTLEYAGCFHYEASFSNGLTENEVDHVFYAFVKTDCPIELNAQEVADYRWISPRALTQELSQKSYEFTPWFKLALQKALTHMQGEK